MLNSSILHLIFPPPRLIQLGERGCVGTIAENKANEFNMFACIIFVTRYGSVVGESV